MTLPPQAAGCSPSSAGQQEGTSEGIRQESKNQVGFEKLGFLRGSYVVIWRPLVASLALHRPLLTVCTAHKEYTVHCESKAALLRQLPSPQAITVRVCFPSDTRHASFQLILAGVYYVPSTLGIFALCISSQHRSQRSDPVPSLLPTLPYPTPLGVKAKVSTIAMTCSLPLSFQTFQ